MPASDLSPYTSALGTATAQVQQAVAQSLPVNNVPANLAPSLPDADRDEPPVFVDGCLDSYLPTDVGPCDFGATSSSTSIVLFGDSHAAMWFPAVDGAAMQFGLNLYNWTKSTCPPLVIAIFSPVLGRTYTECDQWRQNVLARIAQIHPALVILGVARHYTDIYGFTPYSPQWLQGLTAMVNTIRQLGPKVLVIGPVPKPPFDVPGCLSVHLISATACTVPLDQGINVAGEQAEERAVRRRGRELPRSRLRGSAPRPSALSWWTTSSSTATTTTSPRPMPHTSPPPSPTSWAWCSRHSPPLRAPRRH